MRPRSSTRSRPRRRSWRELGRSPFLGALFEGFVASEILKHQVGTGRARHLYYFRHQQGLEIDFVVTAGHRRLVFVEAKACIALRGRPIPHTHRAVIGEIDRQRAAPE